MKKSHKLNLMIESMGLSRPDRQLSQSKIHFVLSRVKFYLDCTASVMVVLFVLGFVFAVLGGIITRQLVKPVLAWFLSQSSEPATHSGNGLAASILFFNRLGAGTGDFAKIMLVWVTMTAGSLMFSSKGHLGVDFFVGRMDRKGRDMMSTFIYMMILLFTVLVLIVGGIRLTGASWSQQMQNVPISKGLLYFMVPVGGFLTLFYTLFQMLEDFCCWNKEDKQ